MRTSSAIRSSRKRRRAPRRGGALYLQALENRILFAVGLVTEFGFGEASGTGVNDNSGLNNHGVISNAVWTAAGKYGSALSFNGSNSWITVNDSASLRLTNGMTLEAWVRPATSTGYQTVILKERPSGGLSYALYGSDNTNKPPAGYINKGGADVFLQGNSRLTVNTWTHLALTYNGSKLILYVNGVAKSKNVTGNILENSGGLRIGGNSIWGEYFNGLIDEVRIYNRALTAAEITTDMNAPITPADSTPPAVTNRIPAPGATGIDLSTTINATFNESIQPATVVWSVVNASGNPIAGSATYNAGTRTATFTPTSALAGNTLYTVTLSGAKDLAGNTMSSPVSWSFTTLVPDTSPPVVTGRSPAADATGVPNTASISVTFNEAVQPATINWQVVDADDNPVAGTPTYNASTRIATFIPSSALAGTTQFTVNMSGAKDSAGNTMVGDETWSFTTAAPPATPPVVIARTPASGAIGVSQSTTVSATFNESIIPETIVIELRDGGGNLIAGTGAYNDALHRVTFTPGSPLDWLTTYTATVSGATDLEGTAMTAPAAWSFTTVSSINDPASVGQWSSVIDFPLIPLNQVLLKDGRILMWDGGPGCLGSISATVYNPATNTFTPVPVPYDNDTIDLFCAGAVVMADGRVLVVGGHDCTDQKLGIKAINIFNPTTMTWTRGPDMFYARWYPTATVLSDGKVLITAGSDVTTISYIPIPELYDPVTNTVVRLQSANFTIPNYPFMFMLPDGNVLVAGSDEGRVATKILNVSTQTWTTIDARLLDGGSAVMYRPGQIMKSGRWYLSPNADNGGNIPSVTTTYVLDMTTPSPLWQTTAPMEFPRTHHNLTILPDGNVLVTGGSDVIGGVEPSSAVYAAELWNANTKTWTTMASASVPRMYHSSSILLPDGRVLSAGGGHNYYNAADYYNAQYYSPTYLFKGPRPVITSVASLLQYNTSFFVETPDAARIASVTLIRNGAVTHAFDEDQRYVPLTFSQTAGGLTVNAPVDSKLAPPGYYMLFIVDTDGVPSIAPFVRFPAPYEDTLPPSVPGNVNASGGIGSVTVTWNASTDNVAIDGYNIYRAATSGFTPSPANLVSQTASTAFIDIVPAGTYYYIVRARDTAGNLSGDSLQASATASIDSTAPQVSISAPASGATLSGTLTVSATASDNIGVAGVQFLLDGNPLGAEDTSSPYSVSWTTNSAIDGQHILTARARDAQGNLTTSAPITVTVNNAVATGLVAAYGFNQGSGTVLTDSSGNNLHGTIANATWTTGHTGGALSFNGVNSMVTIADNNLLDFTNNLTIEAWVRPAAINDFETIVLKERPNGLSYALYAADGNGRPPGGYVNIGTDRATVGGSLLALNTWAHLAMTYNGTTFRLYVNGVQVSSVNLTGNITTSAGALQIGGNNVWGEYFSGLIDDVRIYNRALTVTEIQTDMNTGL